MSCDKGGGICSLSIIAPNGTYVKYYPSEAISFRTHQNTPEPSRNTTFSV